ncbi:energy-coupling factor transporter transmembrane component T [Cellulomonas cellasea]|uniref:Energy-coupling factor transporter transmembrane protein EcfT n=1 Tax=Cellulomonas cellasea TaxID=43670 RepID=A0A7W4UC37_9CELL|nr:energy-coupling factor transporter transmembrane component T [Cellulomonas cellasea]MBB2921359.1 energy-coupling factor transporter transmembrane protein EcfT [Cellulomonas cellasea]
MSGVGFGRPLAHDSVLHRRNPTVKLAVLLVVSTVLLAVVDPWTPLALWVLALVAVARAGRIPWRLLLRAQLLFGPFAVSILAVNCVTRDGPVVGVLGPFEVTGPGLAIGLSLMLRTLLVGTLSVAFVLTTDGARLMTSLHQHVRLGARPTYAVLAGYRMLEHLPERWTTIRLAQAAREPGRARLRGPAPVGRRPARTGRAQQDDSARQDDSAWQDAAARRDGRARRGGGTRLPVSPRALARAAFALLVVTLRQAERMAVAMETRGLGAGPRTVHAPVALDRRDAAFAAVTIGVCVAVIAAAARLGVLASWGSTLG